MALNRVRTGNEQVVGIRHLAGGEGIQSDHGSFEPCDGGGRGSDTSAPHGLKQMPEFLRLFDDVGSTDGAFELHVTIDPAVDRGFRQLPCALF